MPLLEVEELTKVYGQGRGSVDALRGVNLAVDAGEFVSIIGPSGSGKSTLMHILGCLDRPSSGRYRFDGQDVTALTGDGLARLRNRRLGFVFQTFNLLSRLAALDNVVLPLTYAGVAPRAARQRAGGVLEQVGLGDRLTHRPGELSGGEQQRVAIARALVNDPGLILADEPTGNLDTRTGREILDLFGSLNRQGRTLILVTHNPEIAAAAPRIIEVRDGRVSRDERRAGL
ncbi:MAG: ABC transporter ATP-binding protein [bacterium]|nr:ABC transporter ATP-binding protein [bacterium]